MALKNVEPKIKEEGGSLLQLAAIVEESHDAIIGKTLEGIITSWNGGAQKMFGYSPDEVIGKSMANLFPSELKDELPRLLEKVREGDVVADYDSVWLRKDGTRADVEFSISPVHTEVGVIIGASLVGRDITVRKQNEVSIQRMTQLYAALSKCNKAVVHCANEDELFQEICNAAVQHGGMTMAWVGLLDEKSKKVKPVSSFGVGTEYLKDIQISVSADDPFGSGPSGMAIRENRPIWSQDFEGDPITAPWHEGARKFGWRSSASLPLLRNGFPIGNFTLYSNVVNAFDDEAQKLLVEMASDIDFALDNFANKAHLEKSEESLLQTQLIVDNSYDAIIGEDLDGVITSWNGGAERMLGYSAQEVIGKSILFLVPLEKKDEVSAVFSKIKAGEIIADYDSARLRKDGTSVDVAFSSSPIKLPNGKIIGVSCVERDITVRRKSELHIKELNELRAKFINIISHQLRTPLTAVNWNLEILLNGDFGKMEATQHKFLQATHFSSIEITRRINSLLTAMDIEEGRVIYEIGEVSLSSLCAGVANEMLRKCELKNISCVYTLPADNFPAISGDGEKIRTVVTNLIENAIDYTKDGGKIIIALKKNGNLVRFEVKDTGVGIPTQEQHHICTRFFRASNASVMKTDAFGLGLFVAKNFIEQHHGKLGFVSKEGEGTTFWFEIPLSQNETVNTSAA